MYVIQAGKFIKNLISSEGKILLNTIKETPFELIWQLYPITPDICRNHHNRWLCKLFQSSVKFSSGYVNETALILHNMCSFTKSV